MSTEVQLLRDPKVISTDKVLENVLENDIFLVYNELHIIIAGPNFQLNPEWIYYNDGKAWLCKVQYKKKTVFWLSIWEKTIKTSFYFTEKNRSGIFQLEIDKNIKMKFEKAKPIGKLIPLVLEIDKKEQLIDLFKIIEFKKKLK